MCRLREELSRGFLPKDVAAAFTLRGQEVGRVGLAEAELFRFVVSVDWMTRDWQVYLFHVYRC
jgi:hypothetical protein